MAEIGFLEQLGIPAVDERAYLDAQRREAHAKGDYAGSYASGEQARPLLLGAFSALGGLLSGEQINGHGGRSLRGVGHHFAKGVNKETDAQVAMAAGITPEVLKSRRDIRKEVGQTKFEGTEGFDSQIAMAKKVAAIALKHGDAETYGKAISALSGLKVQKTEFDKLQAVTTQEKSEADQSGLIDAFLDGKAVTGTFATEADPETGKMVPGLILNDGQGNYFKPFGKGLSRDDPSARTAGETLDQRIRKSTAQSFVTDLRKQISDSATSLRKFDRMMTHVTELKESGMDASALDASGGFLSWADSAVTNLGGVAKAFFSRGGSAADSAGEYKLAQSPDGTVRARGIKSWMSDQVNDPKSDVWDLITLPEGVVAASKEAQRYRANLMDLAYMAARLAEPSNRGLSDNDIRNALIRLGDSARPEVIMNRFGEILGDAAYDIEAKMGTLYGNFGDEFSNDDIARAVGGDTYFNYKSGMDALQQKHGFSYGPAGEVIFPEMEQIETAPTPGPAAPLPIDLRKASDEEFAEARGL